MKQFLALAAFLISANSFASPFVTGESTLKRIKPLASQAKIRAGQCTDFNGYWVGSCTDGSQTVEGAVVIGQDGCEFFEFNGAFIAAGGTREENHAIPLQGGDLFTTATTNMNWSEDMASLTSTAEIHGYRTGHGEIYADYLTGTLSINNGKLVSGYHGQSSQGTCEFTKQAKK